AYVLHTNVKLHPLLAFVSVLGGIQVMGLWGIFIGPIVASCLHALVKIFNSELEAFSAEQQARVARDPDLATLPVTNAPELEPRPVFVSLAAASPASPPEPAAAVAPPRAAPQVPGKQGKDKTEKLMTEK